MSDVGCRMSDVGCRMSDVGCRMSDVGCRMSAVGCRMSDVGCRMSDVGCRMSDVGCRIKKTKRRTPLIVFAAYFFSKISNQKSRHQTSDIPLLFHRRCHFRCFFGPGADI
jgi:hypothetical protein